MEVPAQTVNLDKLKYERMTQERNRIRDARAYFARQLGPLPAFAGISVAFIAGFSDKIKHEMVLWAALVAFAAMVAASVLYSRMPAYREIRAAIESQENEAEDVSAWYRSELQIERAIYGLQREIGQNTFWWLPRRRPEHGLQQHLVPAHGNMSGR